MLETQRLASAIVYSHHPTHDHRPSQASLVVLSGVIPTAASVMRQPGLGVPTECSAAGKLTYLQIRKYRKGVIRCAYELSLSPWWSQHLSLPLKARRPQRSAGVIGVGGPRVPAPHRVAMATTATLHLVPMRPATTAGTTRIAHIAAGSRGLIVARGLAPY